jgi:regulator of sigma E protease
MVDFLQSFWWFLVLIGVMILLHELGHYAVARLFDVKVEAFSFGFGPRLFGFKRGETDFKVCAFLLGGYVKMTGEQPGDENAANDPRAFPSKPRWQRLLIIFAGPAVNAVLAVALLTGLFMFEYPKLPNPPNPVVGTVIPDGAAARAGVQVGDQIVEFDGRPNPTWEDIRLREGVAANRAVSVVVLRNGERVALRLTPVLDDQGGGYAGWAPESEVQIADYCCGVDAAKNAGLRKGDTIVSMNGTRIRNANHLVSVVGESKGAPIRVVYLRDGQQHETTVTAQWVDYQGSSAWRIGAALQPRYEVVQLPLAAALRESLRQNKQYALVIYQFLQGLVERRMSPKSLDGPIGIARLSGEAAREGAQAFLGLMAMVSLNLAIVNLLPIPLLDGGGILMLLIEMLMQRDMSLRVREKVAQLGLVFLMVVVVFVIYNDISKILPSRTTPAPADTRVN